MPKDDAKQPDTKQPEVKQPEVTPPPVEQPKAPEYKTYSAVFGGPIMDPESRVTFTGPPVAAPLTNWLKAQIAAGKIREQEVGHPA